MEISIAISPQSIIILNQSTGAGAGVDNLLLLDGVSNFLLLGGSSVLKLL